MSKVQDHYNRILSAIESTLEDGVNVFIGGNPAVVQVTKGKESLCLRTAFIEGPDKQVVMPLNEPLVEKPKPQIPAGCAYTGETCVKCHNAMMIRTGTCSTCMNCGDTSSCG